MSTNDLKKGPDSIFKPKPFARKWLDRAELLRRHPFGTLYLAYLNARKLPRQTTPERSAMEDILLGLSGTPRIFEWGSGRSTRYYTRFLRGHGRDFEWHSVEHSAGWNGIVRQWVGDDPGVHLHCVPFRNPWEVDACRLDDHPEADQARRYIEFPRALGGEFDLLFVDGRFRRRCLAVAKEVVRSGGFVLLHDAQRSFYQPDESGYAATRRVTGGYFPCADDPGGSQLWIGRR